MSIEEARQHIGDRVSYRPFADCYPERGVITSVGTDLVFVRYGDEQKSVPTFADLLTLIPQEGLTRE